MAFLSKVVQGHNAITRAWQLLWHNKIVGVYCLVLYSIYVPLTLIMHKLHMFSLTPCGGCLADVCCLHIAVFIVGFIIVYWVFAALVNKLLSLINNQKLSFTQSFVFRKKTALQVLAIALGTLVVYGVYFYLITTALYWVGVVFMSIWGIISFYVLIEIINKPVDLWKAVKRAPRALWSMVVPFIVIYVELYVGILLIIGAFVLLIIPVLWLGNRFKFISSWEQLLSLFSSPFAAIFLFIGLLLLLIALLIFVSLAVAGMVVLYHETINRLE